MTDDAGHPKDARWDYANELVVAGALKLLPKLGYDATAAFLRDAGIGDEIITRVLGSGPRRDRPAED